MRKPRPFTDPEFVWNLMSETGNSSIWKHIWHLQIIRRLWWGRNKFYLIYYNKNHPNVSVHFTEIRTNVTE